VGSKLLQGIAVTNGKTSNTHILWVQSTQGILRDRLEEKLFPTNHMAIDFYGLCFFPQGSTIFMAYGHTIIFQSCKTKTCSLVIPWV